MWCSIPEALGEKIIKSPPRSRSILSWVLSMLSRIASSLMSGGEGTGRLGSAALASWAPRNA
jgi:hypothetical protein